MTVYFRDDPLFFMLNSVIRQGLPPAVMQHMLRLHGRREKYGGYSRC